MLNFLKKMSEEIEQKCPICKNNAEVSNEDINKINCNFCGKFKVCDYAEFNKNFGDEKYKNDIWKIQGILRKRELEKLETILFVQNDSYEKDPEAFKDLKIELDEKTKKNGGILINDLLREYENKIPQNPMQKLEIFLVNLEKIANGDLNKIFRLNIEKDFPLCFGKSKGDLSFILKAGFELELFRGLNGEKETLTTNEFRLSLKAWERIEQLKQRNENSQRVFIATWFDDKHNENIKEIEKAILKTQFKPICLKFKDFPETILEKAFGEIRRSRFVVIDLTGMRSSVFVEFGFARGFEIPTILIWEKSDWKIFKDKEKEFYTKQFQIFLYKKETLRKELTAKIEGIIGRGKYFKSND